MYIFLQAKKQPQSSWGTKSPRLDFVNYSNINALRVRVANAEVAWEYKRRVIDNETFHIFRLTRIGFSVRYDDVIVNYLT